MNSTEIINNLLSFLIDEAELRCSMKNVNTCLHETFKSCLEECMGRASVVNKKLAVESILDYLHDELNTGHWSEVPLSVRRAFTAASYVKTVILLKDSQTDTQNVLQVCLRCLDMGLLLGAPLEHNGELLTKSATFLSKQLETKALNNDQTLKIHSKRKRLNHVDSFSNLKGAVIECLSCPSLETFNRKYFTPKLPVILQDCTSHWPAMSKWGDVNYLLEVAGERTVPIEIGSHYADENWSQKLMTLKDFIKKYFLEQSGNIGYLAQHNLFDQIPELRKDIHIPDYCCLSDGEDESEPDINAWFGPANTVSPLHHDPKNNFLVQVFGTKQLLMFSPNDSSYLYPHEGNLLSNTAQVDPLSPDLDKYPDFDKATAFKCLLEPGDMLYIPPKWWHHVTALDKSFSVSFWWN